MSMRKDFEQWLLEEHGLVGTWDTDRNCYQEFPAHLAWKSWQAAQQGSMPEGWSLTHIDDPATDGYLVKGPGISYCAWKDKEPWLYLFCEALASATPQPEGDEWIPEGWKLVPVEPTNEMRYAYHEAYDRYLEGSIPSPDGQWWAMLDAAPQPPKEGE